MSSLLRALSWRPWRIAASQPPRQPDKIDELAAKLRELAAKDTSFKIFGAESHRYEMNPTIEPRELEWFEREYAVELPHDYREFLLRVGNGGPGPYYGILPLRDSVSDRSHHASRLFLSTPFPLTKAYNYFLEPAIEGELFEEDRHLCGSITLAHEGCGYYFRLVISGQQRGMIWFDGEVSDQGVAPLNVDFYTWYLNWINDSLDSLNR